MDARSAFKPYDVETKRAIKIQLFSTTVVENRKHKNKSKALESRF